MKNTYIHMAKVYNNRHENDHISGPTINFMHFNMSRHQMEKCWKLHQQLRSRKDKKVVQAPKKKEVVDVKVEHAITIHEELHEEDQLKKDNPLD